MNRRGFLKGSVLSGLATLLGIGAKVVEEDPKDTGPSAEIQALTPGYAKKVLELKPILYMPGDGRFLVAPHFEGDLFVSKAIRDQADWPGGQQC